MTDEMISSDNIDIKPISKPERKGFMRSAMKDLITDDNDENKVLKEFFVKENITVRTEMQSFEEIGNFSKFFWENTSFYKMLRKTAYHSRIF